jgi:hypothetical protein
MKPRVVLFAATALLLAAGTAAAIEDPVLNAAIEANQIGEQTDGYLGAVSGASPSADARARMSQINLRRRETYTERATQNGVSVDEYARSFACTLLKRNTPANGSWRDESGTWRRGAVTLPAYCPAS